MLCKRVCVSGFRLDMAKRRAPLPIGESAPGALPSHELPPLNAALAVMGTPGLKPCFLLPSCSMRALYFSND